AADISTDAVAADQADDRVIRNGPAVIGVDGDARALFGRGKFIKSRCRHWLSSLSMLMRVKTLSYVVHQPAGPARARSPNHKRPRMSTGNETKANALRRFFRAWFPWVVLGMAGVAVAYIWIWPSETLEFLQRVTSTSFTILLTLLLLAAWLLFFSRVRWWLRLTIVLVFLSGGWGAFRGVTFTVVMVRVVC